MEVDKKELVKIFGVLNKILVLIFLLLLVLKGYDSYYVLTCKDHKAAYEYCNEWAKATSGRLMMNGVFVPGENMTWLGFVNTSNGDSGG